IVRGAAATTVLQLVGIVIAIRKPQVVLQPIAARHGPPPVRLASMLECNVSRCREWNRFGGACTARSTTRPQLHPSTIAMARRQEVLGAATRDEQRATRTPSVSSLPSLSLRTRSAAP